MSSKRAININLALSSTLLLLLLVGFASSNLNQDAAECTYKLIGISYCSPYVFDQANGAPSKDCCTGIKEIDHNGKRCLCLLFQDVRFNVLRALKLPGACKTPVNFTQCVDVLQLAPQSREAKVFEGYDKGISLNFSTPAPSPSPSVAFVNAGNGTSTSTQDKNDVWGKRWLVVKVLCFIFPFVFISHFLLLV
ncbi:non-specific lipid transfer protein GPI-anchored 14-like [Lotus japonicus]|uniref:non-specific lipid transfer protein GPI-anchored 14-like n=1 Tax=Lotus japonicus TaxID=34305 RepID=UPI002589FB31|nr:non-specific lipid transfer protein GPI-anchored 14-like [Lotus japonicus]